MRKLICALSASVLLAFSVNAKIVPGVGSGSTPRITGPVAPTRQAPDWNTYEEPKPWDYKAAYPSRENCSGLGWTFEVGPDKQYTSLKDVPWLSLLPCDTVVVFAKPEPYKDIIFLASRGRDKRWITITGVPDSAGNLPVLDGTDAVMPKNTGANEHTDSKGMIIIKTPDTSVVQRSGKYKPGYIHITGFRFKNARHTQSVVSLSGTKQAWPLLSAGVYINGAENVAITGNVFEDNSVGVFANSTSGDILQTRNLLIAGNYFRNNGNVGSFSEHNAYTEGVGTVYELNYFAPPIDGSNGDNIKERSAGVVFRYNYIEGGADLIAMRDPESNVDYESAQVDVFGEKLVSNAFVYGNTLVTRQYLQSIIGHGDGGMGTNKQPREGSLYFYNNTVKSYVDNQGFWRNNEYFEYQSVPLIALLNTRAQTTVVARNNFLFSASKTQSGVAAPVGLFYYQGRADYQANWTNFFVATVDPFGGTNLATGVKWDGTNVLTGKKIDGTFTSGLEQSSSPPTTLNAPLPEAIAKRGLIPTKQAVTTPPVK